MFKIIWLKFKKNPLGLIKRAVKKIFSRSYKILQKRRL